MRKFGAVHINGDLGLLLFNDQTMQADAVSVLALDGDKVDNMYVVINPSKVAHLPGTVIE